MRLAGLRAPGGGGRYSRVLITQIAWPFVTDAPLPSSLASICHTRGIEVVEAMEKPAADIDEASPDAVPATLRSV